MSRIQDLLAACRGNFRLWLYLGLYRRHFALSTALLLVAYTAIASAGCSKRPLSTSPPLASAPAATTTTVPTTPNERKPPTIVQFEAEPSSIQPGQSAILRWDISGDVTAVSINQGVGTTQNSGSRQVLPSNSITYTLTATGPGGTASALATVRVLPAPPPLPILQNAPPTPLEQRIASEVQDVYYDYDRSEIRATDRETLVRDAAALKVILADFPNVSIVLEGHCDEHGSAEYNLGLGDRRSSSARDVLIEAGIPASRLKIISLGKERPQCIEADEACW